MINMIQAVTSSFNQMNYIASGDHRRQAEFIEAQRKLQENKERARKEQALMIYRMQEKEEK